MDDPSSAASELTVELFERSSVVLDFAPAEVDAWCSGLWLAWESDEEVHDFIRYCAGQGGQVAALVCRSIALLADDPVATEAARVAEHVADASAEPHGNAQPRIVEAWQVTGPSSQSIVLGCGYAEDSDHALLLELDERGDLIDLLLGGDPHELVYGVQPTPDADGELDDDEAGDDATGLEGLKIVELPVDQAVDLASQVWRNAAADLQLWSSSVRSNERLVRQRLDADLPVLQHQQLDVDLRRGLSPDEFNEANQAALSTLQSALRVSADELLDAADVDGDIEAAWIAVITGDVGELPIEEQRAVVFLEWADWLGAGIGMVRDGVDATVDGQRLVDHVNRCPEVSTSIEKRDRDYAAFAFDVALELVTDAGGIADGALTAAGHAALSTAMAKAWSESA